MLTLAKAAALCVAMLIAFGAALSLVGRFVSPALAQSIEVRIYCEINLKDFGLDGPARGPEVVNGSVFTFDGVKKCTNSRSSQTINLTCTAQLSQWSPPVSRSGKNKPCVINIEECGPIASNRPATVTVTKSNLNVSSTGLAVMTCQLNRNR
jgi:hypothetical protein